MNIKCKIFLCFLICSNLLSNHLYCQYKTISGVVSDSTTGELLSGAVVMEKNSQTATTTNHYGYYTIKVKFDVSRIYASFVGYTPKEIIIDSKIDIMIDIPLSSSNEIDEVSIVGSQSMLNSSGASIIALPLARIEKLPSLLGEPDIFKIVQRMPGVQTGVEGSSGFHVRGGSPDQNLILIDEVPVYNAGHLLGFFSIFNNDVIRNATFIKGGLPARYGGRLSSVLDVKIKEGNTDQENVKGSIGLLSSQIFIEGPIMKDKVGFMVAGRRSYYDLLVSPILRLKTNTRAGYFFYDLNSAVQFKLNKKNRLYYSYYHGTDKGHVTPDTNSEIIENNAITWGNQIHAIRWNRIFSKNIFGNLTLSVSKYEYESDRINLLNSSQNTVSGMLTKQAYLASITDYSLKYRFEHTISQKHQLEYGLGFTYHDYRPGETSLFSSQYEIDTTIIARQINALETTGFFDNKIHLGDKYQVNLGANTSIYNVDDTSYVNIDPRISMVLKLSAYFSLKGSYTRATQYIGLLTSSNVGLPTDLWIPATSIIPPQKSNQYVIGFHKNSNWGNLSGELFYKDMSELVEFREGASFLLGRTDWDQLIASGYGEAYGFEIFAEKDFGRFTGWLSYTLSKNQRHFVDIDRSFPYKYDRRHNFSINAVYHFNSKKNISAAWTFYSGENITISNVRYLSHPALTNGNYFQNTILPGMSTIEQFTEKNNFQLDPYHRLDLGFSSSKTRERKKITWRFGVYNAYCHMNTLYTVMLENDNGEVKLIKYSFAPIMPYFRYEFSF